MSSVVTIPDTDFQGVLIWIGLLLLISLVSMVIFELVRHNPYYFHVYYTRLAQAKTPRTHPKSLFEWIYWAWHTSDETMLEDVGLDGLQFLRFLRMCFVLFSTIGLALTAILIPVNYYAGGGVVAVNVTASAQIYEVAASSFSFISINKIQDRSDLLYIHAICAYMVSFVSYYLLYQHYYMYTDDAAKQLRLQARLPIKDLQHRTVLVSNLSKELSKRDKLEDWFRTMGFCVESVFMNTEDDGYLISKVQAYERTLHSLEKAYMQWATGLFKVFGQKRFQLWRVLSPSQKLYIAETPMPIQHQDTSKTICDKYRPVVITADTAGGRFRKQDVIASLTRKLERIKTQINERRTEVNSIIASPSHKLVLAGLSFSPNLQKFFNDVQKSSCSAFVTFTSPRYALMASQMLLHHAKDGITMRISPAPAPNELVWSSLSRSIWDRKVKSALITLLALALSVLWVYPTYFIS
ncbi:hypothetical protein HDU91_004632, partial [Kappamyces sp. JEL0680]